MCIFFEFEKQEAIIQKWQFFHWGNNCQVQLVLCFTLISVSCKSHTVVQVPWAKGIGQGRKLSHWSCFGSVFLLGEWAISYVEQQLHPCKRTFTICMEASHWTCKSLKVHLSEAFARCCFLMCKKRWCHGDGQDSGASAWVAGGTVWLEIPIIQVTMMLLEGYCNQCVCDKTFPPVSAGLAYRLNYYEMNRTYFFFFFSKGYLLLHFHGKLQISSVGKPVKTKQNNLKNTNSPHILEV